MARLQALILLLFCAATAHGSVWRATYAPFDFSPDPARRIPQYFLCDAPGDLPAADIGDGDLAYVASTDVEYVRRNGAWEVLAHSGYDGWIKAATIVQLAVSSDTVVVGDTTMVNFANKMEIQGLLGLRVHSDTSGSGPTLNTYRSRGTRASPTHVLANNTMFRLDVQAYNQSGSYLTPFSAVVTAAEDQTASARGTRLSIHNTKITDAVPSETLIAHGTKWYIGDPATDNYINTTGLGSGFGRLHVREGMSTGSPVDDNSYQSVIGLYRYRNDSTAPGAGLGSRATFRLEGFTNNSDIEAASIGAQWEVNQTNDTTTRDAQLTFHTMLDNTWTQRMQLTSGGFLNPTGDNTQDLGSAGQRWKDIWVGRTLSGDNNGLGEAALNSAASSGIPHVAMYSAASNQFVMPFVLMRRARGSMSSPTAVAASDFLYLQDTYAHFGGNWTLSARHVIAAESATSSVGTQYIWQTQNDAGSPVLDTRFFLTKNGNVVAGNNGTTLATTATDGFLYSRHTAGQPTGTATAYTGSVPFVYDSTNNSQYVYNSGWKQVGGNVLRVTADVSSTSTSFANVTGLTFPVKASTTYHFECNLAYTTAITTTALQLSINGPSTPTTMRYCVSTATTATATHYACQNTYDTVTNPATGAESVALPVVIAGTLENAANAGTLAIRLRSEVSSSTVTVLRGSFCQVQQF